MTHNVVTSIVANNLCIGCGVCAGICPADALVTRFNDFGELNPELVGTCRERCNLCIMACPFSGDNPDENSLAADLFSEQSGMAHSDSCGYYLNSYAGFSRVGNQREIGASGGIATWILETLLMSGAVDHCICVSPSSSPGRLYNFSIASSVEDIRRSSKSAYYPVDLSEAIRYVLNNPGRYAVTALPCFAKGLRLAARRWKALRERIPFIIGLVCGQLKSSYFTDYVSGAVGLPSSPRSVIYRGKDPSRDANDFFFLVSNGSESRKIYFTQEPLEAWVNRWFTPNACSFCDDVFAELADLTVMDAWLPEYIRDPGGTSLLITRNAKLDALLGEGAAKGELSLSPMPLAEVLRSQATVIEYKRNEMPYRLFRARSRGVTIKKRLEPAGSPGVISSIRSPLKEAMQRKSREIAPRYRGGDRFNARGFRRRMIPSLLVMKALSRIVFILHKLQGRI